MQEVPVRVLEGEATMKDGDIGAREIFFLLLFIAIGIGLSWALVLFFTTTLEVIGSFINVGAFIIWASFQ